MSDSLKIRLPDPIEQLKILEASGDQAITELERRLVDILKSETVRGVLEHSQNQIYDLAQDAGNRASRSQIVIALEHLVFRNILNKRTVEGRKSSPSLYSLKILVETARESWSTSVSTNTADTK